MGQPPDRGRSILSERALVVRQVWPTPNTVEYHVSDDQGTRLATAAYLPKEEAAALMQAYGLRAWTAAALRIAGGEGETLFTVAFPGMRARAVMLVRDGEGRHLGEAVKTKGFVKIRYELRQEGRCLGAIQVLDWRERGVRVEDAAGAPVVSIRTTAEGYSVEPGQSLTEPLRSLVGACCVALQAAMGDETKAGEPLEHGGGTTVVRVAVLPPILDRLRRKHGSPLPRDGDVNPGA